MEFSIASHILNSFSRNLGISARTFKMVRWNPSFSQCISLFFLLIQPHKIEIDTHAHALSINLANELCCFLDYTAKSSEKQNDQLVCSLSYLAGTCFTNLSVLISQTSNSIICMWCVYGLMGLHIHTYIHIHTRTCISFIKCSFLTCLLLCYWSLTE